MPTPLPFGRLAHGRQAVRLVFVAMLALTSAASLMLARARAFASNDDAAAAGARQPSPVTASLAVQFPGGKTTYRIGEEIPITLELRGQGDEDYSFFTGACGPWMSDETFDVTPREGHVNPFADVFASGGVGGSCAVSSWPLDGRTYAIHVALNDWIRFTQPGTYTLLVSSRRLQRYSGQPVPMLRSTPVAIRIVPADPTWTANTMARAVALIDHGSAADVAHGAALLRDLDTEAAAVALVSRYDAIASARRVDMRSTLIASCHRAAIITRMEARLDRGDSLDATFIPTLTTLRRLTEPAPASSNMSTLRMRDEAIRAEYEARWRAAIDRHAVTAETLEAELRQFAAGTAASRQQVADELQQHPVEAAAAFTALSLDDQQALLVSDVTWPLLRHPWIEPALRRIYDAWPPASSPPGGDRLGDYALTRLDDIAPDDARSRAIEEMRTGAHGIRYDTLASLLDAGVPNVDADLRSRFDAPTMTGGAARGTTAWLMARYGTAGLESFVRDTLSRGGWSCEIEGGLVAYQFEHDPAAALAWLEQRRTAAHRNGCRAPMLGVAVHYWDARLEAVAIDELQAPTSERVVDAAQVLGAHGSAAARQPLLDRFTAWSTEWRGRAMELVQHGPMPPAPVLVERHLVDALLSNPHFVLTAADVVTIRALCVTDDCRATVDRLARERGIDQKAGLNLSDVWGDATDGIQLRVAVADTTATTAFPYGLPVLNIQARNQGASTATFELAFYDPEIEVDGVWHAIVVAFTASPRPVVLAPGDVSAWIRVDLSRMPAWVINPGHAVTSVAPIRLSAGRHDIRVSVAATLRPPHETATRTITVVSNAITIQVPGVPASDERRALVEGASAGGSQGLADARQLASIYPDAALDAIRVGAQATRDDATRAAYVEAAFALRGAASDAFLRSMLTPANGIHARASAAAILFGRGYRDSVSPMIDAWRALQPRLASGDDDALDAAGVLIGFLSKTGDPAAIDALGERLHDAPVEVRLAVADALLPPNDRPGHRRGWTTTGLHLRAWPSPLDMPAPSPHAAEPAIRRLLFALLNDNAYLAGLTATFDDDVFNDPRVSDLAAFVLSQRWPRDYSFRWTTDVATRDAEIGMIRKVGR